MRLPAHKLTIVRNPEPSPFDSALAAFASNAVTANWKPKSISKALGTLKQLEKRIGPIWTPTAYSHYQQERAQAGITIGTRRADQAVIDQFVRMLLDRRDDWSDRFLETYGSRPLSPISDLNRLGHIDEDESILRVRPVTFAEFRAVCSRLAFLARNASSARERRTALRDGGAVASQAAFGLRSMEVCGMRLSGCNPHGKIAKFGNFGAIDVIGKSKPKGEPRPRTVYATGYFDFVIRILQNHVEKVMPLFRNADGDSLFVDEAGIQITSEYHSWRFSRICKDTGLSKAVTSHGLRRMHATTLAIAGVDLWFIKDQLGHENIATTQRYIHIPTDFQDRQIRRHQDRMLNA